MSNTIARKQSEVRSTTGLPHLLSRLRTQVTTISRALGMLTCIATLAVGTIPEAHAQQWIQGSIAYSINNITANSSLPPTVFFTGFAIPGGPNPISTWTANLIAPPGLSAYNLTSSFTATPGFGLTYNSFPYSDDAYTLALTSASRPGYTYTAKIFTASYTKYQAATAANFTVLWAVETSPPPPNPDAMALGAGPWTVAYRLHTTAAAAASQIIQSITVTSPTTSGGGARWSFPFPNGDSSNPTLVVSPGPAYTPITADTEYDWCLVPGTSINFSDPTVQAQFMTHHIRTLPPL